MSVIPQMGVVLCTTYALFQSWMVGMVINDAWKGRWGGRMKMDESVKADNHVSTYADTELEAFYKNFRYDMIPNILWIKTFVVVFGLSIGTAFVWGVLAVFSQYVVGIV